MTDLDALIADELRLAVPVTAQPDWGAVLRTRSSHPAPPRRVLTVAIGVVATIAVATAFAAELSHRLGGTPLPAAFRIVGLGNSIPTELDKGPCPEGRWSAALYAAGTPKRIGTEYGCGLATSKRSTRRLDPASIHQRSRETFVLPGHVVKANCDARFAWTDVHHSRATFRCAFAGGTIAGGGPALDGRANYLLRISR